MTIQSSSFVPVIIIGKFVPKTKSYIIALGISITVLILSQIILKTYCLKTFKKEKLKKYCKNLISNKLIHFITFYITFMTLAPLIHNLFDQKINRKAYLTLKWFEKYIHKMSKYNLHGSNFNIHATIS